ncbi:MAG: WD40 repeat domain-containing serine/threonine-protein kinase [Planctomycetota bacterium]|nr:WD40 repeat domain-containing serine/threonine-protein kinase [Planctomycetota bacterium]
MLKVGDQPIPGYRIDSLLGRGQFGEVWRATSPGGAQVALKFLDLRDQQGLKELRAVQQIKTIRHPHLASVIALWLRNSVGQVLDDKLLSTGDSPSEHGSETDRETQSPTETSTFSYETIPRQLVIATLLCDKNLNERLKECQAQGHQGIPPDELLNLMTEAAKGIDFLNAPQHLMEDEHVSIQHCDIKPANLMLTGASVMIGDFGLARFFSDHWATLTGTEVAGSPAYMAPECFNQRPSQNTDQYSLAITYFELRTGRLPFQCSGILEVLDAHRSGNLDLSALPPLERKVISRATSLDPDARFDSCHEMVCSLVKTFTDKQPAETLDTRQRQKTTMVLGGLILALLLAFAGNWLFTGPTPQTSSTAQISGPSDPNLAAARTHANQSFQTATLEPLDQQNLNMASEQYQRALRIDQASYAVAPSIHSVFNQPETDRFTLHCLATLSPSEWLVTRLQGSRIALWELAKNPFQQRVLYEHQQSPDSPVDVCNVIARGSYVVSADLDERVSIAEIGVTGNVEKTMAPVRLRGWALSISFDQRWLVTGDLQGQLLRWDLNWQDPTAVPVLIGQHREQVHDVHITPDNQWAISSSTGGEVRRWKLQQPDPTAPIDLLKTPRNDPSALAISDDNQFAAIGNSVNPQGEYPIELVRLAGGPTPTGQHRHLDTITCLSFCPQSPADTGNLQPTLLASGGADGSVHLWNLTENTSQPLTGQHQGAVHSIAFVPLAGWLATGSDDGTVRLWNYHDPTQGPLVLASGNGRIAQVVVTPQWLIAGGHNGTLVSWDLRRCLVIKHACDALQIAITPAAKND